jgi:hypothetical protein
MAEPPAFHLDIDGLDGQPRSGVDNDGVVSRPEADNEIGRASCRERV